MTDEGSANKSTLGSLVPVVQTLIWVSFAIVIVFVFKDTLEQFLSRANKVAFAGIEIEAELKNSEEILQASDNPTLSANPTLAELTEVERQIIARRWQSLPQRKRQYRILVAHDVFAEAKFIQAAFLTLGFDADIGICPKTIETLLRRHAYDLVISDIDWSQCDKTDVSRNGVEFLKFARRAGFSRPTIFYILNYQPELGTPPFAAGISNRWNDVLNLTIDVLSRSPSAKYLARQP